MRQRRIALSWVSILLLAVLTAQPMLAAGLPIGAVAPPQDQAAVAGTAAAEPDRSGGDRQAAIAGPSIAEAAGPPRVAAAGTMTSTIPIDGGGYHTCALLDTGQVKCWGNSNAGQLGLGDQVQRGDAASEMGAALPAVNLGAGRTAVAIATGENHTCVVLDTRQVKCWGYGAYGQVGLGDTASRGDGAGEMGDALPTVDLGTGRTAAAIGAGVDFTCALLDNGQVKCWGYNAAGKLGLGDQITRGDNPGEMGDALPAVSLGADRTATAIAVGSFHTCALLDIGQVKCWGSNTYGQLGLGNISARGDNSGEMGDALPAVDFGTGRTAKAIAAGNSHTCALLDTGEVKCWGRSDQGQLGLGSTTARGDGLNEMGNALPAVDLGAGRTARSIASGYKHTCALLDNAQVKCWGLNLDGQLGLGDGTNRGWGPNEMGDALPAVDLGAGRTAIAIAAGAWHTCALLDTGALKCWGLNANGQLGLGDTNDRGDAINEMGDALPAVSTGGTIATPGTLPPAPANQAPIAYSQAVTTAEDTPVAITLAATDPEASAITLTVVTLPVQGTLSGAAPNLTYTPNANFNGTDVFYFRARDGSMESNIAAVTVTVTSVNDVPVAAGRSVLTSRNAPVAVALVASDADGNPLTYAIVTTPTNGTLSGTAPNLVYSPTLNFTGTDTFTFIANDGSADSNTATVTVTVRAPLAPAGPVRSVVQAGADHTCALLDTGQVKCWGSNSNGRLGLGDTNNRGDQSGEMGTALPAVDLGTDRTAVAVFAGDKITCALLDTRQVKCWGKNDRGQLGQGDINPRGDASGEMGDALTTVELGTGRTATAVAGGDEHTCALLDTGQVKCWGRNLSGQLGLGDALDRGDGPGEMGDALPAVSLGTGRTATAITAGGPHTCALLDNGQVKCWGADGYGELGIGPTSSRGDGPGEMGDALPAANLGTGRTAAAIAAGTYYTCALLDTGEVKCWGYNSSGRLGLGDTNHRGDQSGEMGDALPAADLGTGRTATAIAAGNEHTCALLDNGQVKCWGYNYFGQLGLGDTSSRGDGPNEMGDALPAVDLGAGRTAVAIAAGGNHTCARLDTGAVKCWGYNWAGQLGLGNTSWRGDGPNEMGDALPAASLGGTVAAPGPLPPSSANQAPTADSQAVTTAEDMPVAITLTATDPESSPLTFAVVVSPAQGTLSGAAPNLTYTPNPNFHGTDHFSFRASDGSLESPIAAVTITVTSVNDVPVAAGRSVLTSRHAPVAIPQAASDADGDPLSVVLVVTPTHGTLGGVLPTLVYSPALDFTGVDVFAFRATDGSAESNLATVTVTVRTPLIAGLAGRLVVQAGGDHGCAVLEAGALKCWGSNSYGQLGLGDVSDRGDGPSEMGSALPAVDLGIGRTAASVSAGGGHTCALLDTDQVKCWGFSQFGRLGLGDTIDRGDAAGEMGDALPAVDLGAGRTAVAIATGVNNAWSHTCAILDTGQVKCWGHNADGELGLGDRNNRGWAPGEMGDALPAVNLGTGRTAAAIATGGFHTCALLDTGEVKCWGFSDQGQLGLGDKLSRGDEPGEMGDALPAVDLGAGRTATAVAAGSSYTCAILDTGQVKCWGRNYYGQLGLGDKADRGDQAGEMGDALPAIDLGAGRTAVVIAPGGKHTCALLDDGNVKCWGYNSSGQLGLGDQNDRGDGPGEMGGALPAVNLGTGRTALAVDAGVDFTCALLDTNQIKCWGYNGNGRLGLGDVNARGDGATEMGDNLPVVDLAGAVLLPTANRAPVANSQSVSTPEDTAVAITLAATDADGDTLTYTVIGGPAHGALGGTAPNLIYTPAANFNGADSFTFQASDGVTNSNVATVTIGVTPVNDPPVAFSQSVSTTAGTAVTITLSAADADGDALTYTVVTAPGHGTLSGAAPSLTYSPAAGFAGVDTFTFIASDGNLESNTATVTVTVAAPPAPGGPARSVVQAGSSHTCALLETGEVKCWGGNNGGQLGLGDKFSRGDAAGEMGAALPAVNLGTGRTAASIAVGGGHSCALLDTGQVKCWGWNGRGDLGLWDTNWRGDGPGEMGDALPTVDLGIGRLAVALSAGGYDTCALLDNGQVKCWGSNDSGQLGLGDVITRGDNLGEMGDALPAVDLGAGRRATAIAAGTTHTCALLDNGQVKCWGDNFYGQLGLGDTIRRGDNAGEMGDALPAVNLGAGRTATAIAVGNSHTCAVLDTGQVKCWGSNSWGELGLGNYAGRGDGPGEMGDALPAVNLGAGRTATALAAGYSHTCALLDNGQIKCWGGNTFGQLGLGNTTNRGGGAGDMGDSLPAVDLGAGRTALAMTAGDWHTCALLDNGQIKCWGRNHLGQDGLGDTLSRGDGPGEMGDALPVVDLAGAAALPGPVPPAPANQAPIAGALSVTTAEDTPVAVTLAAADPDGDPVTFIVVVAPAQGTLSGAAPNLTYTPKPNFFGADAFYYRATDGSLESNVVAVAITVTPVADAPVADDRWLMTSKNAPVAATLLARDADGEPLTYTVVTPPAHGTLSGVAPSLVYSPALDFTGVDTFTFRANAGGEDTNLATVTVTVRTPLAPGIGGHTVLAVAGWAFSTCALLDTGEIKCWGQNTYGQLGLGDVITRGDSLDDMGSALPAVDLGAGRTGTGVALGNQHACAVLDTGQIKCWGDNFGGGLGQGDTVRRGDGPGEMGDTLPAVDLGIGRTALATTAGAASTCALLDTGQVKCWGANGFGGLGQGDTVRRGDGAGEMGDALPAVDLGIGRTAVAIDTLNYQVCALLDTGQVKCWGYNITGGLGQGDSSNRGDGPGEMGDALPPVDLGTGRTAVGITVGSGHACALLENGPVKCWGSNYDGRLGLGDMSHRGNGPGEMGDALPAVNLGTGRTAVAVAAGYDHTCAILDGGQVKCWGRNTYGQLGLGDVITRGDTLDNMGDALPAVDLGTGRTAIAIAAGISQTCVVLDNRRIKCWGRNHLGQLGLGDLTNRGDGPGEMGDALPYVELAGLAAWPVVPTNQAPIASSQSVTTTEDTAVAIILAATDPDGSSLTFAVLNAPTHGTLSGTAPNLTYTPDPNFHGADAFTFRVSDGVTNSTVATVAIAVTPVNDPPVAADDTATTVAGQAVSIAVLANDADADGDALRVVTATQGTNGTVVANPNGTVTYTPNAGFSGTDSFTYTATDDHGGTDTATVAVTVRAPVAGNEVRDVRQSNVTDVSFTLSFLSRFPAIASVAYWISGTLPMTPTLAADFRTAPGETHWVRVGGSSVANRLLPETTYRYAIALDGQPMADGWVRTGRTLGERGSDGVFGRVVDRWGNPVPGAIVYLDLENLAEVISGTATHPTSALLSDVTQGDGYWWIDLGGARTRDLMARFAYAESDLVHLEAFGQADGFGYADLPVGVLRSAPLDIQLRPVVGRPVHLGVGWNAVGLPLEPTRPISVSQLARAVNRDGARLTAAFRYTAGAWQGVAVDGTGLVNPQADFPLKPGEGYFLKLREPFTWELVGHEVTQATPLRLALGWNLVGVPQADDAWQPDGLRASNLSDATGIISGTQQTYHVGEVDRWIYGSYEGHVAPHPFNNFRIEGTRSYFLKANRAGTLIPGESGYGLPPE